MIAIMGLSQADVAYLLRRNLGPGRAWEDLLADMRSGETTYLGLTLLPVAKIYSEVGKIARPVYEPAAVAGFITAVKRIAPPPAGAAAINPIAVAIHADAMAAPWSARRAVASKSAP